MKKKICSKCGKVIGYNEVCKCSNRNEYQRNYYEKNKDRLKMLNSSRWKKLRSLIIERDGGCCQRCLIKYGIINSENLEVHHIKPRIKYPELMFEESNLITLCETCNLQIGTAEQLDFEPRADSSDDFEFHL